LRLAATKSLMTRRDVLVVASVSCIYGLGSPTAFRKSTINLFKNQKILISEVAKRLTELQYERNPVDLSRGTFRIKGDSLEVYPAYEQFALRLSFLGDSIEEISQLHPVTLEKEKDLEEILIFP